MWGPTCATVALLLLGASGNVRTEHVTEGDWTLLQSRNQFKSEIRCELRGKGSEIELGAIVFRFSKDVDTSGSWVRIGNDPALLWRKLIPELRQMGIRLRTDDLANPSGGRVAIPIHLVDGNSWVWIAPADSVAPRRFAIAGLHDVLVHANDRGCHFFIPVTGDSPNANNSLP